VTILRHLPNFICLVRIALIWPTIDALYSGDYWAALALVAVCAVSDGLDGWLAKRFNWTSDLGKNLDPLADKLLLVSLFLAATWINLLPWWLTAVVVARDVMIGGGAVIFRFWFGRLHGRPTILSKINTGMQLAVALAAILGAATGLPTREMVIALAIVTLMTTIVSGADYLSAFTRRALATGS
jgi:cardiolipin synthase (CMP-forming)